MTASAIFRFYLQLIAAAKSGKETSPEALAGWCLLHKPSFRLPEAAEKQAMLQFRLLKRLFGFSAQASPQTIPVSGGKEGVAVFDNNPLSMPARIAHLEQNTDQQPEIFISRKNLLEQPLSLRLKFQALFISFRLLLIVGPRVQRALLLYEVFEAATLLRIIQEKRINLLPLIIKEIIVLDDHERGFIRGTIEGSDEVENAEFAKKVKEYLKGKIGKNPELHYIQNKNITAGYRVTVEDIQFDASVDNQLEKFKESILG